MLKQFFCFDLAFCILIATFLTHGEARVHDFETARLKSTGGAGVGSILMDEATLLNPAPIALFRNSALYISQAGVDVTNQDIPSTPITKSRARGFIISDTQGGLNGSISLLKQEENGEYRQRLGASLASPVGTRSAFGLTVRKSKDDNKSQNGLQREKYTQMVFGVTHVLSPSTSIGLIAIDPFRKHRADTRGIAGIQYVYKDFISLMLDMGSDYGTNLSHNLLYRAGAQFKVFRDFFLRFGLFNDKGLSEKGNGFGVGWVQPKLVIDFALKNTTVLRNREKKQKAQDIVESIFSLSYRF